MSALHNHRTIPALRECKVCNPPIPRPSFEQWMARVDREIARSTGLSYLDLADYGYRDAYDDELSPREVAADVLAAEGFMEA
jgi:hypothetical protein